MPDIILLAVILYLKKKEKVFAILMRTIRNMVTDFKSKTVVLEFLREDVFGSPTNYTH